LSNRLLDLRVTATFSRPKLAGNVRASVSRQPDTGCRCPCPASQCSLRHRAGSGMARYSTNGRCALACFRVSCNHCTRERMPQSGRNTAFIRPMILQVFVERSGNHVFDRRLHRVRCETGAYPLAEAGRSATPLSRAIAQLSNSGASPDSRRRALAECTFLPMLDIGMTGMRWAGSHRL
jgi:hypothetical protein